MRQANTPPASFFFVVTFERLTVENRSTNAKCLDTQVRPRYLSCQLVICGAIQPAWLSKRKSLPLAAGLGYPQKRPSLGRNKVAAKKAFLPSSTP
jgi:hypothetical protein